MLRGSSSNPSGTSYYMSARPKCYLTELESVTGAPFLGIDEVKEYLKVTHSKEDLTITSLIEMAIEDMEAFGWMSLRASTYKVYTDRLYPSVPLIRGPVSAVTSVQYYDIDNALQTLDASMYYLSKGTPDRIMQAPNVSWPGVYGRQDAVIVTYTTNPTVTAKVKGRAKQAIGYLFENRSNLEMRMTEIYKAILMGVRRNHF